MTSLFMHLSMVYEAAGYCCRLTRCETRAAPGRTDIQAFQWFTWFVVKCLHIARSDHRTKQYLTNACPGVLPPTVIYAHQETRESLHFHSLWLLSSRSNVLVTSNVLAMYIWHRCTFFSSALQIGIRASLHGKRYWQVSVTHITLALLVVVCKYWNTFEFVSSSAHCPSVHWRGHIA